MKPTAAQMAKASAILQTGKAHGALAEIIAQALADERERCAVAAGAATLGKEHNLTVRGDNHEEVLAAAVQQVGMLMREASAAAIRAAAGEVKP